MTPNISGNFLIIGGPLAQRDAPRADSCAALGEWKKRTDAVRRGSAGVEEED